jgi:hypothetical protein
MGLLRLSLSLVFSENWLILQRIIHTQSLLEGISICENFLMRRVEVVSTIIGISWSMLSLIVWTWERFQWFGDNSLGKTPLSPLHMRSWIAYLWIRNGNWNTYDFMYALYLLFESLSDHAPILITTNTSRPASKRSFKFELEWLQREGF